MFQEIVVFGKLVLVNWSCDRLVKWGDICADAFLSISDSTSWPLTKFSVLNILLINRDIVVVDAFLSMGRHKKLLFFYFLSKGGQVSASKLPYSADLYCWSLYFITNPQWKYERNSAGQLARSRPIQKILIRKYSDFFFTIFDHFLTIFDHFFDMIYQK